MNTEANEPKNDPQHFHVSATISKSRLLDLFTTIFDSPAVTYWVKTIDATLPDGFTLDAIGWLTPEERERWIRYQRDGVGLGYFAPLVEGGSWEIIEHDGAKHRFDTETLLRGFKCFMDTQPGHYGDFVSEQDDADTADAFLQCCLFGKQVYG